MTWNGGFDDRIEGKRGQVQFAGTARRVLRTNWTCPFSPPEKPVVTVVHSLPGRVRVRLSVAPRDVQRMFAGVREHPGMASIVFSPATRSVLARFNPHEISQEESYCESRSSCHSITMPYQSGSWRNRSSRACSAVAPWVSAAALVSSLVFED